MSVSGLVRREDYDAMVHQRDEWRALYLDCCDLLTKARSEHRPVTYQPCPRHAGMSMVFTTTHTARAAMPVCPGCHPPPNLVRDSDVLPLDSCPSCGGVQSHADDCKRHLHDDASNVLRQEKP